MANCHLGNQFRSTTRWQLSEDDFNQVTKHQTNWKDNLHTKENKNTNHIF